MESKCDGSLGLALHRDMLDFGFPETVLRDVRAAGLLAIMKPPKLRSPSYGIFWLFSCPILESIRRIIQVTNFHGELGFRLKTFPVSL